MFLCGAHSLCTLRFKNTIFTKLTIYMKRNLSFSLKRNKKRLSLRMGMGKFVRISLNYRR